MQKGIHTTTIVDLFSVCPPLTGIGEGIKVLAPRVPVKRVYLTSGQPVMALVAMTKFGTLTYVVVTREPKGYLFDHEATASTPVTLTEEDFSLSDKERDEVEEYLKYFM